MPLPLHFISFSVFTYGKSVASCGKKYHGSSHFVKFATIVSVSFNLWMSHNNVDTFVPIIIILNNNWMQRVFFVIKQIIKRVFSLVIYKIDYF
jgi:hypothetical protein